MDNQTKLNKLLDAIEDITSFPNGSITIHWKASVGHDIPGHLVNMCQQSMVNKAHQIHLNPELVMPINEVGYDSLQHELDEGIRIAYENAKNRLHHELDHGCSI